MYEKKKVIETFVIAGNSTNEFNYIFFFCSFCIISWSSAVIQSVNNETLLLVIGRWNDVEDFSEKTSRNNWSNWLNLLFWFDIEDRMIKLFDGVPILVYSDDFWRWIESRKRPNDGMICHCWSIGPGAWKMKQMNSRAKCFILPEVHLLAYRCSLFHAEFVARSE